ncbi:MAG: serine/threonine-protein kinase [Myxococcota bacterium]
MNPGTIFADRYQIQRIISTGLTGVVCEAEHLLTRQPVVLKLIRGRELPGASHETWKVRFRREVRAAAGIKSRHAVTVYDAGTDPETEISYIAMECLQGEDAGDVLRRLGSLPVDVALRIVYQACHAVQVAHDVGIVHRDIKPGNLFLSEQPDGSVLVKLLDFGLAKAISDNAGIMSHNDITGTGVLGTPSYMSPEQAQARRDVDYRTDVWSLGAVLHHMLSGHSPFQQSVEGPAEVLIKLSSSTDDPGPVQALAPWVPPEVAAIVHRALRRERTERYSSVRAMRKDILALLPEGDELTWKELVPLSRAARRVVAPAMTLEHLDRTTQVLDSEEQEEEESEVLGTKTEPPAVRQDETLVCRPSVRRWWLLAAAVVFVILLAALATVWVSIGLGSSRGTHSAPPPASDR